VVKLAGDEAEPIQRLPADLSGNPQEVARGGSPDNLVARDGVLYFSDLGRIARRQSEGGGVEEIVERDRRIAGLARTRTAVGWLESPYEGASPTTLWVHDGKAAHEITPLESAVGLLAAGDERLFFYDETPHAIHAASPIERPRRLALTGAVSAMTVSGGWLYFAEAHEADAGTVTLLRRVPVAGGEVERLGRTAGTVTALAAAEGWLYWSGERGLVRLELTRGK
jgi:hypothetical protein